MAMLSNSEIFKAHRDGDVPVRLDYAVKSTAGYWLGDNGKWFLDRTSPGIRRFENQFMASTFALSQGLLAGEFVAESI